MITPIPIEQIAFKELISSVAKEASIPKVSVSQGQISSPAIPISAPMPQTGAKGGIKMNQVLVGITVLVAAGFAFYWIRRNKQEKLAKSTKQFNVSKSSTN